MWTVAPATTEHPEALFPLILNTNCFRTIICSFPVIYLKEIVRNDSESFPLKGMAMLSAKEDSKINKLAVF